jgi:cytochrome d ubiquinol oxidase subunit I
MEADSVALLLARIQFAFTVSFHFIFPSFSIGLASYLAVLEWRWLRTGEHKFLDLFIPGPVLWWAMRCWVAAISP